MPLQSRNARTGQPVGPELTATSTAALDHQCRAAAAVAADWAAAGGTRRAALLRGLADALEQQRETLVPIADEETGLGPVRLSGELDRTTFQLRRFADLAEAGVPFRTEDDPAVAGGPPAGHPAMQRQWVPLGPVAMFAASNFPFAFSLLGGDTASALAAGCPVVLKAHNGHLALSEKVFALIRDVLKAQSLPAALISMVQGEGNDIGVALIRHPTIAAGAFTGSTRGGAALQAEANQRPRPIPFFGELGSVNPVVLGPAALAANGAALAQTLAASICLGCGQFCTSPGILLAPTGAAGDAFVTALADALRSQTPHVMLTAGMRSAFEAGVAQWVAAGATALLGERTSAAATPAPFLASCTAEHFVATPHLHDEVFGPGSLVVRTASVAQTTAVLAAIGGSLTVTLLGADEDTADNRSLVRAAMNIAGRVLFTGVPTGVAVCAAQHHGGPWPASTQPATTSVGDAALWRFLRPVALQDTPAWLKALGGQPV